MAASNLSPDETVDNIEFSGLRAQQKRIRSEIDKAIAGVLDDGTYIMGTAVSKLEDQLASFCHSKFVVTCSSGTDALLMTLMAAGIGRGDAVIVPAFTFSATPEAAALLGATCVFADVCQETFNIDPDRLEAAVSAVNDAGLRLRAIVPVDLFGQPADYDAIIPFAEKHNLFVLCDAAQAFGASSGGSYVGQFGNATATSFFPSKPLGCYGDGGAVITDDCELESKLRSILLHGRGRDKYEIVRLGINGRLDTIQAAVLLVKLKMFSEEIRLRNVIAARYTDALSPLLKTPQVNSRNRSVWAQYTIKTPARSRDDIQKALGLVGVPTSVYYPSPLHQQPAYRSHLVAKGGVPVAEQLCREVLSLPMHPYLSEAQQQHIISSVVQAWAKI